MAKYGEGDKRWIVEERADGTNVHNWHWAERDCLEWSRARLSSLLAGLTVLDGEGGLTLRTVALDKLDGEAYVNIRKGKVIPGYELSLTLSWEAEAEAAAAAASEPGAAGVKVAGAAEVPYLADENADEDPDLRVTVRGDETPLARRAKDAFLARGKPLVLEKIREFVAAMAEGGPAKDELESKKATAKAAAAAAPGAAVPAAKKEEVTPAPAPAAKEKKAKGKDKEGFKTIEMTEKFYCRAKDIYEILMDENRWKGFTQSNARISREVGGEFSLFDGSITGRNEELQEGKLIAQKWRFGSWPDGLYSSVRLVFDEPESGVTIIKLKQTDVPEEDKYGNSTVVENTERGWRELIFQRIRGVFGFGI
ncbi:hypothetical protein BAE44_0014719 [Dichanthelium oligosanthes]|uniref:Activator of Hsp90 ATPase AHSA1-like N-terminal domain-containing protein n=1 Tax=Dichanthelium oligosanthes TaxID=888268 RepID=A0A1E5VGL7_9POAL|nr:hypothetical protein BAE44_0014719 [Dichanthelium oligosanthes]